MRGLLTTRTEETNSFATGSGDDVDAGRSRAQMTIDFAAGVGIFLLAVAFVAGFAFTIMGPFTNTAQTDTVVANQAADHFGEFALQNADRAGSAPTELDRYCTDAFFGDVDAGEDDCNFNETAKDINKELSTPEGKQLHLRIEHINGTTLTQQSAITGNELVYRTGEPGVSSATTTRIVTLEGVEYILVVEVM